MSNLANTFDAVARYALLQSTVIFLIGMLIARFAVRRPARVHTVLVLAFLAAIAAPLASEAVRRGGWGVLPPEPGIIAKRTTAIAPSAPKPSHDSPRPDQTRSMNLPGATEASPTMVDSRPPVGASHDPASRASDAQSFSSVIPAESTTSEPAGVITIGGVVFATVALAWSIVSAILLGRLLSGVIAGRRILRLAARCDEPAVHAALTAARDRLGMNPIRVEVFQSSAVRCPMIWCWAARPQLLLPVDAAHDWSAATWTPVLCHELAHWKRRDHWAALIAEVVCCLMPWQVLAWWAKRRLENASEQACDDWTVAVGHSAIDYAETLLGLVAQADLALALAALRRRSGLAGRIQHILSQTMPHPRLGRLWAVAVLLFAVISIGVAAVCQRGVARADAPSTQKVETRTPTVPSATAVVVSPSGVVDPSAKIEDSDGQQPKQHKAMGRVLDNDGQPVSGANVIWEAMLRPVRSNVRWPGPREFARTKTGAEGRFALEVTAPHNATNHNLVIHSPELGVRAYMLPRNDELIEVRFESTIPIVGSIFTADGTPVKDAKVVVRAIHCSQPQANPGKYKGESWSLGHNDDVFKPVQQRDYWPAPVVTDAQGQFRFENLLPQQTMAELFVIANDFPITRLNVATPGAKRWGDDSISWRGPTFTLVLETPYVVEGRVLDETTLQPIKDVRVEVKPNSNGRSMLDIEKIEATSDSEGRYTVRVGSADLYFVKIFPPLGYPSLQNSISSRQITRLAGAGRTAKYEVKLRKGIVLKGRVIDAETGNGVPGAQVYYKAEKGRKLGVNDDFFPVTTADDGTFEVSAVDGKGFFVVDSPDKGYYRLAVLDSRVGRYHEGLYPHGMIEIDVPAEGQREPFVIPLKRGPPLALRVLAPDGTPADQLRVICAESSYEGTYNETIEGGVYRLDAAEPGRKYRVFINCEEAKAGGVFEVEAPADGKPIEVTLQPWATIRGRYVYDGGAPAPEITNFTKFRLYAEHEPDRTAVLNLPHYGNFSGHHDTKAVTDADGNFELNGIIPGAFIYLGINNEFADGQRRQEVGVLNAGEVKDVGELVIHANR